MASLRPTPGASGGRLRPVAKPVPGQARVGEETWAAVKILLKNLPGNAEKADVEGCFSRRSCQVDHVTISGTEAIVTVANEESKI